MQGCYKVGELTVQGCHKLVWTKYKVVTRLVTLSQPCHQVVTSLAFLYGNTHPKTRLGKNPTWHRNLLSLLVFPIQKSGNNFPQCMVANEGLDKA